MEDEDTEMDNKESFQAGFSSDNEDDETDEVINTINELDTDNWYLERAAEREYIHQEPDDWFFRKKKDLEARKYYQVDEEEESHEDYDDADTRDEDDKKKEYRCIDLWYTHVFWNTLESYSVKCLLIFLPLLQIDTWAVLKFCSKELTGS